MKDKAIEFLDLSASRHVPQNGLPIDLDHRVIVEVRKMFDCLGLFGEGRSEKE